VPLPSCPICGGEVFDWIQQQSPSSAQAGNETEVGVIICHCSESHRFLAPSKEDVLTQAPDNR
jgi:hypothetical protein